MKQDILLTAAAKHNKHRKRIQGRKHTSPHSICNKSKDTLESKAKRTPLLKGIPVKRNKFCPHR